MVPRTPVITRGLINLLQKLYKLFVYDYLDLNWQLLALVVINWPKKRLTILHMLSM